MKSYTDLEQSKILAGILPHDSADMIWVLANPDLPMIRAIAYKDSEKSKYYEILPAWSLAALLNVLAKQDFIIKSSERNNECQYNIDIPSRHCKIWFSSLLDAAFEMIIWLKENNKL